MVTSNCTVPAPLSGVVVGGPVASAITLVERIAADSAEWVQTVRRVMARTRWRKSTQALIGFAVLAFVAAVVAAAMFFTTRSHGAGAAHAPVPPPRPPTVKPGVVPVADTAETPSPAGVAAALGPAVADPNLGRLGGRITDALTGKALWQVAVD